MPKCKRPCRNDTGIAESESSIPPWLTSWLTDSLEFLLLGLLLVALFFTAAALIYVLGTLVTD